MSSRYESSSENWTENISLIPGEVPGLVPGLQSRLNQLVAQPAAAGREEYVWNWADHGATSQVSTDGYEDNNKR